MTAIPVAARRLLASAALGAVLVVSTAAVGPTHVAGGATAGPLPVTPYSGFNRTLTRAPYVTDLTQTSAYINWATTSSTPGSVQVAPMGAQGCPTTTLTWSAGARPIAVPKATPYVQVGSTATTTSWRFLVTNGAGVSTAEFQASVEVSGLAPNTAYCYSVFSTDSPGAVNLLPAAQADQTFTTLSAPNNASTAPVKFDVIDDTGENYYSTATANGTTTPFPNGVNPDEASLYHQIGTSGAQFLVDAGDTAYNSGTQSNFGDLQQTGTLPEVSTMFGPSYYPQTGGIPMFASMGDHNQNNTSLKIWPTPVTTAASGGAYDYNSYNGSIDGISGSAPDAWYAFSTGNVRVYVIDGAWAEGSSGRLGTTTGSLCGAVGSSAAINCEPYQADADEHWQPSSTEYKWLAADLAAHPGGIKFAVFQFPMRSDITPQPSDLYTQNSSANPNASTSLESLLSANGVDVTFSGHAHAYQRFIPKQRGQITSYDIGSGGGSPRTRRRQRGADLPGPPAGRLRVRHRLEPDGQHRHLLRCDRRSRSRRRRRRRRRRCHADLGRPGLQLPRGVGVGHVDHRDAGQRRWTVLRRPDLQLPPGARHHSTLGAGQRAGHHHRGQLGGGHLAGLDRRHRRAGVRHLPQRILPRHGRRLDHQLHRYAGDAVDDVPLHGGRLRRLGQRVPAGCSGHGHDPDGADGADALQAAGSSTGTVQSPDTVVRR